MNEKLDPADILEHGTLSEMLKTLLERTGLSARELAKRVPNRVSPNYISTLARGRNSKGKRVQPNPKYLRAIADAFAYDPLDNVIDPGRSERLYRRLMSAEGYDPPAETASAPAGHAKTVLYAFFQSNSETSDTLETLALLVHGKRLDDDEQAAIQIAARMIIKARLAADQQPGE